MMEPAVAEASATSASETEYSSGVRLLVLNLPEDEGEGLGFRLTRTLWDPYPWVREVTAASRADAAGLKAGDCLLQADGKDLLGMPIGQVAGLIRGDGAGRGLSLLVWSCGVDPQDDPELLWSCGGGSRGERARRALSGVLRALACCVCAATATATAPLCCKRSHLYCEACWSRLERCALCREPLPPKESPYARNLIAEQVFEAIATEYEIKNVKKRPTETSSACVSPNRSPNMSPSVQRRGQYQLSLMNRKKHVQFSDKFKQTYASDPNLHRSSQDAKRNTNPTTLGEKSPASNSKCSCQYIGTKLCCDKTTNLVESPHGSSTDCTCHMKANLIPTNLVENQHDGHTDCTCQAKASPKPTNLVENPHGSNIENCCQIRTQDNNVQVHKINIPEINVEESTDSNITIPHKLVARLRQACSLADLQNTVIQTCQMSRSLNNLGDHCKAHGHHSSLENLKSQCNAPCDLPVFLLTAPPIYVVTCDHGNKD